MSDEQFLVLTGRVPVTRMQATGCLLAVREIITTIEVVLKLEVLGTQNLSLGGKMYDNNQVSR